eukprot:1335702-Amorphochlora_amoeboformis.AAC.1
METFTNADNGVSARCGTFLRSPYFHCLPQISPHNLSCPYDLVLYIPKYDSATDLKKFVHRFKAPATRGTMTL